MYEIAREVLTKKSKAVEQGKVHFEVVYGKQMTDPLDSIAGVVQAYFEHFGQYPENYGKFPEGTVPAPIIEIDDFFKTARQLYMAVWGHGSNDSIVGAKNFLEQGGDPEVIIDQLVSCLDFKAKENSPRNLSKRIYLEFYSRAPTAAEMREIKNDIALGYIAPSIKMLFKSRTKK
jgi:hypothetical protein